MKLRSIKYYFEEAFKSIFRNSLMSFTSILTVSSCILILVFSYCIAINIDYGLEQLENTVGISVYIDDSLSIDERNALYEKITALDNVDEEKTRFISKSEGLQEMIERYGENADILEGLEDDNPIRDSFSIALIHSREQGSVISALEEMKENGEGIVKIRQAQEIINKLVIINNIIRGISVVIALVLGLLSIIIIMNTIKLTVNNRKNEIGIMKYVGATDWFIKWPFIIEGIIIGIVGAFIPAIISAVLYSNVIDMLTSNMVITDSIFRFRTAAEIFPTLVPIMVVLGLLIGAIGSLLSMRKYLDV